MVLSPAELTELINRLPRVELAVLPTPLEDLPRLHALLGGPRLLLKRDDLTGLAMGGNKARKLEWMIADALKQGADVIVTSAAAQSNMLRMTCAAARRYGLDVHLVMRGTGREPVQGNLLLDHLFGADMTFIDTDDPYSPLSVETMEKVSTGLAAAGRKPYVLDMRYHTGALATIGYVGAAVELQEQLNSFGIESAHVVCSTGSGTTQAGLLLGFELLGLPFPVTGVSVQKRANEMKDRIVEKARSAAELLSVSSRLTAERVEVDDRWIGEAYGEPTAAGTEAVLLAARQEGILFDLVYSGKGLSGVIGGIRERRFAPDVPLVFIHTGGTPALFAMADEVMDSRLMDTGLIDSELMAARRSRR